MTDDLDQKTDAELSEIVAVECAGWTIEYGTHPKFGRYGFRYVEDDVGSYRELLKFATSADAVLPLIVSRGWAEMIQTDCCGGVQSAENIRWRVRLLPARCGGYAEGEAKTLPRAACIALVRAARAEKGGAA